MKKKSKTWIGGMKPNSNCDHNHYKQMTFSLRDPWFNFRQDKFADSSHPI